MTFNQGTPPRLRRSPHSIVDLADLVHGLSREDQQRFNRLYYHATVRARLRVPRTMAPWVEEHFSSLEAVESQQVVRVVNRVTGEGTLFNPLRAQRPVQTIKNTGPSLQDGAAENDVLARPLDLTPEDPFGRLKNRYGVTAANIAKYDTLHSLVVFNEADPLAFSRDSLAGHLELARRWVQAAHAWDDEARYPYILWNCLWRAGGSLLHGHLQVALARGMHYAKIERLRNDAEAYRQRHGVSYFEDLAAVHLALGCAYRVGQISVLAHLTPVRDKEVVLLAPGLTDGAIDVLYQALVAFRDRLGVRSFNMGVLLPPVAPVPESWDGFPTVIRLVDRGALQDRTSDVGGMELFAESVVASDPFAIAQALQQDGGR